jgi:tetratricopeptide (TPR) repeat protein
MDFDFKTRMNIEARARGDKPAASDTIRMQADMVQGLGKTYRDHLESKATLVEPGVYELNPADAFIKPDQGRNTEIHPKRGDVVMTEQPIGVRSPEEIYVNQRIAHVAHLLKIEEVTKASEYLNETFSNEAMPNTPEAYELRGMMRLGVWDTDEVVLMDPEGALQDLQYAAQNSHSENLIPVKKNIAFALSLNGEMQASADLYEEILTQDLPPYKSFSRSPDEFREQRAECHFHKARCHLAMEDHDEAKKQMHQALSYDWSCAVHASVDPICQEESELFAEVLESKTKREKILLYRQLNTLSNYTESYLKEADLHAEARSEILAAARDYDIEKAVSHVSPRRRRKVDWSFEKALIHGGRLGHDILNDEEDSSYKQNISKIQDLVQKMREELDHAGTLDLSALAIKQMHFIKDCDEYFQGELRDGSHLYQAEVVFTGNCDDDGSTQIGIPNRSLFQRIGDTFTRMGVDKLEISHKRDTGRMYLTDEVRRVTEEVSAKFDADIEETCKDTIKELNRSKYRALNATSKEFRIMRSKFPDIEKLPDPYQATEITTGAKTFTMEVSATRPVEVLGVANPFKKEASENAAAPKATDPTNPFNEHDDPKTGQDIDINRLRGLAF